MANGDLINISVKSDLDQLYRQIADDTKNVKEQATVRALNKLAAQIVTAASKNIRDVGYGLKASDIKETLKIIRATSANLTVKVVATGRPIPMIKYGARQVRDGVSVNILNGRKVIAGAFIATMPNGHTGVFVRQPGAKHKKVNKASWHALPIRELYGPAVPDALANAKVQEAIEQLIESKFDDIFTHEVQYLLR